MTVRRGIDPRRLTLVTGGGATGVAAVELARELGIRRAIVPRETSVLCAFGALNADLQWSSVASHPASLRSFDYAAVNATLARLVADGETFLDRLQVPAAAREIEIFAAARYPMQVTEIEVRCSGSKLDAPMLAGLAQSFHSAHQERYAVAEPDADVEFVMWRVVARGTNPGIGDIEIAASTADSVVGETTFYDTSRGQRRSVPLIDLDRIGEGQAINGPALLVASDTTVVVPSQARVSARPGGHLLIEIE